MELSGDEVRKVGTDELHAPLIYGEYSTRR